MSRPLRRPRPAPDPRGDGGDSRRVRCVDCGQSNMVGVRCACTLRHVPAPAEVLAIRDQARAQRAAARLAAAGERVVRQVYCPHSPPCTPYPCSIVRQVTE